MTPALPVRRDILEAVAVALLVAVLHVVFRLSAGFLVGALNDDGVYVVLGKAIAEGEGYRSIHLVGSPVHQRYPPGLPLLLAIPWTLTGSLTAVRATVAVVNLAATAGAAGLVWWLGRRELALPPWPLAVCAIAPFVLDGTIQYYNIPLSEPYFVLGWAAALVLAVPLFEPGMEQRRRLLRAAGVGFVLAATTLFRSAGVVLIPAMLAALALHRHWRAAAGCALGSLLPLTIWSLWRAAWVARGPVSTHPDDLGYWQWLGLDGPLALLGYAGRTVATNIVEYVPKLASYLFSSLTVGSVIVCLAMIAVVFVSVKLWRDGRHTALIATTLGASTLTLLWPFAQGRLLLPLLPFLGLLTARALAFGIRRVPARVAAIGVPAALGLVLLMVTLRQLELRAAAARAFATGRMPAPHDLSPLLTLAVRSRFIHHVTGLIVAKTTPQDRVMVDAPAAVYLYTGRRTVVGQPTESRLAASVFADPGRYLAERLLSDSITAIVWAPPAQGLETDLRAITIRCPRVLARETLSIAVFYRVTIDEPCLRGVMRGGGRGPPMVRSP